jgi:hypothetical protein
MGKTEGAIKSLYHRTLNGLRLDLLQPGTDLTPAAGEPDGAGE